MLITISRVSPYSEVLRGLVTAGVLVALAMPANAGDILRGGAALSNTRTRANSGSHAGADVAAQTQANAKDRLARTTQALNAMKGLQAQARAAAAGNVKLNNPNRPGKFLPTVRNGLGKGGLQVDPLVPNNLKKPKAGEDASLWVGANLPRQTTGKDGGKDVTIVQTDQQALLTWKTFNVGKKTTLTFDQSAGGDNKSEWIAFNKINDPSGRPSQILGSIKADGQVYVINQNGIIFGGSSQVNVHTLVASSLPINTNLIANGLLNNPDAQFLFDAKRTDDLAESILANQSATLSQMLDPRSALQVVANIETVRQTGSTSTTTTSTLKLVKGRDYTLVTDKDRRTTVVLTEAGKARTQGTGDPNVTVTLKSIAANYSALAGDVVVDTGAQLSSPTSAAHVGGRVMLAGANVRNAGTISTPDGQTILAAGLQVGIAAHSTDDPSLRGLDVSIGQVADAGSGRTYTGTAVNEGLIEVPRANATIAGRSVQQNGFIDSSTTVNLNGRIDLVASYNAISNNAYDASGATDEAKTLFVPQSTGIVTFGENSVTRILPELDSADVRAGDKVAIRSQVNATGLAVHFAKDSTLLAPSAEVSVNAGNWNFVPSTAQTQPPTSEFVHSAGQVYIDSGALLDVSGTTNVSVPLEQSILTLELRGAELADSPLQREGPFRGTTITIDSRITGTFNGKEWVGTPLGDATGFLDLIERGVGQLTTAGGSIDMQAGESVVVNHGATLDVSGGWQLNEGGLVKTTKVVQGARLIDISDATPDQVYDGIYDPKFVTTGHSKWGISQTFRNPLSLDGAHVESSAVQGAAGGSISIIAPSMALDGTLAGRTVIGPKQIRTNAGTSTLPKAAALSLTFRSDDPLPLYGQPYMPSSPQPPKVVFGSEKLAPVQGFALDAEGAAPAVEGDWGNFLSAFRLSASRRKEVILSPELLGDAGFGSLTVNNGAGDIFVPEDVALAAPAEGSISLSGRNITIDGSVTAPGGSLSFTANNVSPWLVDQFKARDMTLGLPSLFVKPGAGRFVLGSSAVLSTAGLTIDQRDVDSESRVLATGGGDIAITAYSARLAPGSLVDVSGGILVDAKSGVTYADAGSISILAGRDPNLAALFPKSAGDDTPADRLLGGRLSIGGELRGYSGAKGGSLALQAPFIQVGGGRTDSTAPGTFFVQSEFFDRGGFTSFDLTGIGGTRTVDGETETLPGLVITANTVLAPRAQSLFADPHGSEAGRLAVTHTLQPVGAREPVSLGFHSLGMTDEAQNIVGNIGMVFRGDLVMENGVAIRTDPGAKVAFSGSTVSILGSVSAPAGEISITGGKDSVNIFKQDATQAVAMPTVYLGPESRLSTAGTVVRVPDDFGRRVGSVLPGGTIKVAGNIVATSGAVLDVSGASGVFDVSPLALDATASRLVSARSGLNAPLQSLQTVPVRVDSDGGAITLAGGEELFTDATLLGRAGGPTAQGGALEISSGRFSVTGSLPTDVNLIVTQSGRSLPAGLPKSLLNPGEPTGIGQPVLSAQGEPVQGLGHFAADTFLAGGFDSLTLGGVVRFKGAVDISARGSLKVASGGVLYADDRVHLAAPYVALGMAFPTPLLPTDSKAPFTSPTNPYNFAPTHGPGVLTVEADLIDIGTLSLRNVRRANFVARGGDIRGAGTLDIAGHLNFEAGQIYTPTALSFTAVAYDYQGRDFKPGDDLTPGSIAIHASGSRQTPLSAGGTLSFYASDIVQAGVLRAPMGTINLGWDGTGDRPADLVAGTTAAFPITTRLVLGAGSITSVSAVDSRTGEGLLIPYGLSLDGTSWIAPTGEDITASGLPAKDIHLSATRISTKASSQIDLRGGGDLYAYRWVEGNGGTRDILASEGSFAVIPGYDANYAPVGAYNSTSSLAAFNRDPQDASTRDAGYVNETLSAGDRVYLGASDGLPAGEYTLLPARYALLPGAFLVTPKSGASMGATLSLPTGAALVSGYRFNALDSTRKASGLLSRFEVISQDVVRKRAQYDDFFANSFLRQSARDLGIATPLLPNDAGHLVFQATDAMHLNGIVRGQGADGGRGAFIDVSSPADIVITGADTKLSKSEKDGAIVLSASRLSSWGAESLLVGGIRSTGESGTEVAVNAGKITVDNAGSPLTGPEIILVANDSLTLAPRAEIAQTGSLTSSAERLVLDGDGTLLRVSSDIDADFTRENVSGSDVPKMVIGAGARLTGTSLTLDSTHATDLSAKASLFGQAINLGSGQISLRLGNAGDLLPTDGLVLAGRALHSLERADSLSLSSYSSIDIYGSGTLGRGFDNLELHAGEIRGFHNGVVTLRAGTIALDNATGGSSPGVQGPSSGKLKLVAQNVELGDRRLRIDQFDQVGIGAAGGVLLNGKGGLLVDGDLEITTAAFFATGGASEGIRATGDLLVQDSKTSPTAGLASEVGASLTMQGARLTVNSDIFLPSGLLTLHATEGDVNVNGRLDVGGTEQVFNDLVKYTGGGAINLLSDAGDVNLGPGATLSVAAAKGGGDAGSLSISAAQGSVALRGTLLGQGGAKRRGGSFSLDVGTLPELAPFAGMLSAAKFTQAQTFRVRQGDVLVNGVSSAHDFRLSADQGSVTVTGTIDASGATGGDIFLAAAGSLVLADGAQLDASGATFDHAGKGGAITLEAGDVVNGSIDPGAVLDIQSGSKIDLSVSAANAASEDLGRFTGTLHLRAPQTAAGTDLRVDAIDGSIVGASSITLEGYRIFDLSLVGGLITGSGATTQAEGGVITSSAVNVQQSVKLAGETFGNSADAITSRLFTGTNASLLDRAVVMAGAEIVNRASYAPVPLTLADGGSITVTSTGGSIVVPAGTTGAGRIKSSAAGAMVTASGKRIDLPANTLTEVAAGSTIVIGTTATVSFSGDAGSTLDVTLAPGATFTASAANSNGTVTSRGSSVSLATPGSSAITLDAGTSVLFTTGTPGTRRIVSTVAGTIVTAAGATIALAANTPTAIAAGSTVTLATAGKLTYANSGSGTGAPVVALLSGGFSTSGAVGLTPSSGNLTLGTDASGTAAYNVKNDWDLHAFRFGAKAAPGVLTLRAAGNLVFNNTLSDGFAIPTTISSTDDVYRAPLMEANPLLPMNAQSWSFRLAAGADFSAVDYRNVTPIAKLAGDSGSLKLGRIMPKITSGGSDKLTSTLVKNRYQVIRTGSGDIDIAAGRDVQLLNQFATIYTAGVKIADATLGGTFDMPYLVLSDQGDTLGAVQQDPASPVQFSLAGGNVNLHAQGDIAHYTKTVSYGPLVADSERQLPVNWLYRRGYVDPTTGRFGVTPQRLPLSGGTVLVGGDTTSTAWWIDFSNFFEGVGALGGGNVSLTAGGNISNVDAAAPTNARLPANANSAGDLVEVGGGDLTVRAGRDIDGGVYYVERGEGVLSAGGAITTNATRSPSVAAFKTLAATSTPAAEAWLPTTLFLGKGRFDVSARGDVLLGPTANVFLLPEGLNNSIWYKTWFSTYAPTSEVDVASLGGSVTLRTRAALPGSGSTTGLLQAWLQTQLLLGTSSLPTSSYYQPWLRINETSVAAYPTVSSLLPPTLRATAFTGDLNLVGAFNLAPAEKGTLELAAGGAINGLQPTGGIISNGESLVTWGTAHIDVSDADPTVIPGVRDPFAYRAFVGPLGDKAGTARETDPGYLLFIDNLFAETGSLDTVLQTKQALHAPGLLHAEDSQPLRLYALTGDISGVTLFSPKAARIVAGQDITDNAFYLQNVSEEDVSVVAAGRNLLAYNASSPLRALSEAPGNLPPGNTHTPEGPLAGDIQLAGPGTLEVLAGRTLDLGTGASNDDGTEAGIVTVGNARNPHLPFAGANIVAAAGLGPVAGLSASDLDFDGFIDEFLSGEKDAIWLAEIDPELTPEKFAALPVERRDRIALEAFYLALRDAGRAHSAGTGSYDAGFAAIDALFPNADAATAANLETRSRNIRTKNGGDISLLVPHGGLTLATSSIGNPLAPPGIITESGGNISIFADKSVNIGIGRIFTLRGGNEIIWSSHGDIAAGAASKTVKSAPPTRVLIDPQSADVKTDLAGLSTGGGIGVLATVAGVPPGDVDLIAPTGVVDAGDAGIRVSGNLNIAATQVLNADNISVTGSSTGVPSAPVVAAPNITGLTSGNNAAGAANSAANAVANQARTQPAPDESPSVFDVQVVGYGGDDTTAL